MLRRCRPPRIGSSELNDLNTDPVAQSLLRRILSEAVESSGQAAGPIGPERQADQTDRSMLVILSEEVSPEPRRPRGSEFRLGGARALMWAAAVLLFGGLTAVAILRHDQNESALSNTQTTPEVLDVRAHLTTLAQSAPVDGLSIDTSREVPSDSIPPNPDVSRKASVRYGNQTDYVEVAVELGEPSKSVTVLSEKYKVLTVVAGVTIFSRVDTDEMQAVYAVRGDLFVSVSASGSARQSVADLSTLAQYIATNW